MLREAEGAPYGSWTAPITSDMIVSETIRLGTPVCSGSDSYEVPEDERPPLLAFIHGGPTASGSTASGVWWTSQTASAARVISWSAATSMATG